MFWCAAAVAGIVLALGRHSPAFELAYELVPAFRSLRYPEKFLLLPALAAPSLAAAGVERLLACYRRTVGAQLVVPADVLRVLARLASPEACRWEGRVCVTHSWGSDVGTCPHGEAQQLLGGAA